MNGTQYRLVADLQDQIDGLEARKQQLLNNGTVTVAAPVSRSSAAGGATPGKRTMSPEAKARIAAAQKKRWAKIRKGNGPSTAAAGSARPGGMSAAGRKRIAKAQKERWAKIHAAQAAAAPAGV
jgi:hypothetical protein